MTDGQGAILAIWVIFTLPNVYLELEQARRLKRPLDMQFWLFGAAYTVLCSLAFWRLGK